LKALSPEATSDAAQRAQFLLEARVARDADRARVMVPYRVFESRGCLHAVYEWPAGRSLAALPVPLDHAAALEIGLDVALAVASMHRQGLVHGALRADAVIVDEQPTRKSARLLDLGMCVPRAEVRRTEVAAARVALAPENRQGAPLDESTDIYGFGALCFGMLTGVPWSARGGHDLPCYIPPELARLVLRCLSPRPTDRPQTMAELAEEMERIQHGCERANQRFEAGLPEAFTTSGFGPHSGWFIDDGARLTTSQWVSFDGYAPERGAGRRARVAPVWVYGMLALLLALSVILVGHRLLADGFETPRMQPERVTSGEAATR
jgi:serine/threonine-protein kinase